MIILTSPLDRTPWPVFQNVRVDTAPPAFAGFVAFMPHTNCGHMVSGSLHFPSRVLCSFLSRYYYTIGLGTYLGFEVDAPDFRTRFPTHATQRTYHHPVDFPLQGYHPLWRLVPEDFGFVRGVDVGSQLHISTHFRVRIRIALYRFRSPLLTVSQLMSFLLPTKMLQLGRFPYPNGYALRNNAGCPIQ